MGKNRCSRTIHYSSMSKHNAYTSIQSATQPRPHQKMGQPIITSTVWQWSLVAVVIMVNAKTEVRRRNMKIDEVTHGEGRGGWMGQNTWTFTQETIVCVLYDTKSHCWLNLAHIANLFSFSSEKEETATARREQNVSLFSNLVDN